MGVSGAGMPGSVAAEVARLRGLADGDLEEAICEHAAHLAAAEYRWMVMIAEYACRDMWSEGGFASPAHWLSWRCGLRPATARERIRVACALEGLPKISAAFARGELSYSQVRALTRVADADCEGKLLQIARYGTAAQLERVCRAVRTCRQASDPDRAEAQQALRSVTWHVDDDGMIEIVTRLPVLPGARVLAGMNAAVDHLDDEEAPAAVAAGDLTEAERTIVEQLTGTPAGQATDVSAETSAAAGRHPADAADGSEAGPEEHDPGSNGTRPHAAGHVDVSAETSHGHNGDSPAAAACGDSAPAAAGAQDPAPDAAVGGLDGPSPQARRRADGMVAMAESYLQHGPGAGSDRHLVVIHVDRQEVTGRWMGRLADGTAIPDRDTLRALCEDAVAALIEDTDGNPLYLGRRRRLATRRQKLVLQDRDGGCIFPGCTHTTAIAAHHTPPFDDGGTTDIDAMALLCRTHHLHTIHRRGWTLTKVGPQQFVFTDPDGKTMPVVPPRPHGDPHRPPQANHDLVLDIDEHTPTPEWDGSRLNLDDALYYLLPAPDLDIDPDHPHPDQTTPADIDVDDPPRDATRHVLRDRDTDPTPTHRDLVPA